MDARRSHSRLPGASAKDDSHASGHRPKDRRAIAQCLELLDQVFVDAADLVIYRRHAPPKRITLKSKLLVMSDYIRRAPPRPGDMGEMGAAKVRPREYGTLLFDGPGRQTALLARQALAYDYYRQDWEKRLARYFAFQWAIRKSHGTLQGPFCVQTFLTNIQKFPNERYPQKTRGHLENALDTLALDGIIRDWQYVGEDQDAIEPSQTSHHWLPTWLTWSVTVVPPVLIEAQ